MRHLLAILVVGCAAPLGAEVDLGDFEALGKADAIDVDVPFEVAPGKTVTFGLRTVGQLRITTDQDTDERLQLIAESDVYRRRSWRGRSPFIALAGTHTGGALREYSLTIRNWGDERAAGVLSITTDDPGTPGITMLTNQPECADCDPAGELRNATLDVIQSANFTIDLAIYGVDDPAVIDALCEAAAAGVRVRVVSDDEESTPGEAYHDGLHSADGLEGCGVPVEIIDASGIMHNKYLLIDAGTDAPVLLTGSANFTESDFEHNHNHMMLVRGAGEMVDAFVEEFEQLFTHCVASGCGECTPACVADVTAEGPWDVAGASVQTFFSPSDDALVALRGPSETVRRATRDRDCGPGTDCLCRTTSSGYKCDYCGLDGDWGHVGRADDRVLLSAYVLTDTCLAVALSHAEARGAETTLIIDKVNAGSPYSMHGRACEMSVPTYVSQWARGSNHNKLMVIDDIVVSGSMNFSEGAVTRNNENTLVIHDGELADVAAELVRSETRLLEEMGVDGTCESGR